MFTFELNAEAIADLNALQLHERKLIIEAIETQLTYEPQVPSKNRKLLRPNVFFTWELRRHPFRIFYEVDLATRSVLIQRVGRKDGSRLYIRGKLINLDPNENDNPQ